MATVNIHSRTVLVGVFPVIAHLDRQRQSLSAFHVTKFAGKFSLPFEAAWGETILPKGDYALYFGDLGRGTHFVEIIANGQGHAGGIFIVDEQGAASVVQNSLICTRRSGKNKYVVRALELPAIGKSVSFAAPSTRKVMESRLGGSEMQFATASI